MKVSTCHLAKVIKHGITKHPVCTVCGMVGEMDFNPKGHQKVMHNSELNYFYYQKKASNEIPKGK